MPAQSILTYHLIGFAFGTQITTFTAKLIHQFQQSFCSNLPIFLLTFCERMDYGVEGRRVRYKLLASIFFAQGDHPVQKFLTPFCGASQDATFAQCIQYGVKAHCVGRKTRMLMSHNFHII
jgi:hypothetical protein